MMPRKKKSDAAVRLQKRSAMQKKRLNMAARLVEQAADTIARRSKRRNPDVREAERAANTSARKSRRDVSEVRRAEQAVNTSARKSRRDESEVRRAEQAVNTSARKSRRDDSEVRRAEQAADTIVRRSKRRNPYVSQAEKVANTSARKSRRDDSEVRRAEQAADTIVRRSKRRNPDVSQAEKVANTSARKSRRDDSEVRRAEQAVNTSARKSRRDDSEVRREEQAADTASRRSKRKNPDVREAEQAANSSGRKHSRMDPQKRSGEQQKNSTARKQQRKLDKNSYEKCADKFQKKINQAPTFVCSCCGGLWYESSTTKTSASVLKLKGLTEEMIERILFHKQEIHRLCSTCKLSVTQKSLPLVCLSNGFRFPDIPDELKDLSELEESLVALRIPFMQIKLLGTERQKGLRGNVVNVEHDLDTTATVMPRKFNELSILELKLMRKMSYTAPYLHEKISPFKVFQAAKYLVATELYLDAGVAICDEWAKISADETMDFHADSREDVSQATDLLIDDRTNKSNEGNSINLVEDDDEQGNAEEVFVGADETLIFDDAAATTMGVRFAPCEGKSPIPLSLDPYADLLSYPAIYCGKKREFSDAIALKASKKKIAKSELRMYDRRCCKPKKVLHAFKMCFNEDVYNRVQVFLRKRTGSRCFQASEIRDPEFLRNVLNHDEGYAVFKTLRSSPSYWQGQTKKLLGMIRQLGKCTFFITLSAAETKWTELKKHLMKTVRNEDITDQEAEELPFLQSAELIRSDPVTCMRHFHHKYQAYMTELLKPDAGVFAPYKLKDFYTRMEFQLRGSPHSHGLYWLDAPTYTGDEDSEKECVSFIDNYITCERKEDGLMKDRIAYQLHDHTHTCRKKSRTKTCRFDFPRPPMEATRILMPLPSDIDSKVKKMAQDLFTKIREDLNKKGRSFKEVIPLDEYVKTFGASQEEYILAIRSSITKPTVFLKRSTNATFVNNYNQKILEAWNANMDIQFVLNTYSCAKYCAGYIMKAVGGVSKLLQLALQEFRKGNTAIRDKLKRYASILINGSEISAQEAVAYILGISNTDCSRQEVYISTGLPEERVRMVKSTEELEGLEDESEDVFRKGLLDYYSNRPMELNETCLAEFASWYEYTRSKLKNTKDQYRMELIDKTGCVRKRSKAKIIRFRHFNRAADEKNHCREQLMLYVPWRDEQKELLDINPVLRYSEQKELIRLNSQPYVYTPDVDEDTLRILMEEIAEKLDDGIVDNDYGLLASSETAVDEFPENETNIGPRNLSEKFLAPKLLEEDTYRNIMRTLNDKQRRFALNVVHLLKLKETPFYMFLSGGAGVGKTQTINAIIQMSLRYFQKLPTENPDEISILVCAPTGKAAFNVLGMTLHSTFRLPKNQKKGKIADMDSSTLTSVYCRLRNVKLIIVDEISMVSSRQLYQIHQRLRQIFSSKEDFGNIPIVVVGDFRQLPPVGGSLVFKPPTDFLLGELLGNNLWERFSFYELEEVMRQRGEKQFCQALNNLASGTLLPEDLDLLRSRQITRDLQPPPDAIRLFLTNDECVAFNASIHDQLGTEGAISTAHDTIEGPGSTDAKKSCLVFAKNLNIHQCDGLRYEVRLQVGAQYFVSTNIDVEDGLFNGATGTLMKIDYGTTARTNERVPERVWLNFHHLVVGLKARQRMLSGRSRQDIQKDWTPIQRIERTLNAEGIGQRGGLKIIRKQIPLVASNGMTVHKSQGSSLPAVVVKIPETQSGRRKKVCHLRELLYVAFSRATSVSGLHIDGDFQSLDPISPDDPVTAELNRLRDNPVPFKMTFFQDHGPEKCKVFVQNVTSFRSNFLDLKADQSIMSSDFLLFLEPHLLSEDEVCLPAFDCMHRIDCQTSRNSEGILLFKASKINQGSIIDYAPYMKGVQKIINDEYLNPDASSTVHRCVTNRHKGSHCIFLKFSVKGNIIVGMYKSPKYPRSKLVNLLEEMLCEASPQEVYVGDINVNMHSPEGKCVLDTFEKFGFSTVIDINLPSNDNGSHIDVCFSNFLSIRASFYESYYSIHKGISLLI